MFLGFLRKVGRDMESPVKILSMCPDTLVLNCYPTNAEYEVTKRDMLPELRASLEELKKLAQLKEEPVPTRFTFGGYELKMQAKGGDGFNWILKNTLITLAVNRSSKMQLWAQVRCSSLYLQTTRDLGKVVCDVHLFLISVFGQLITLQPSSVDLAVDLLFFDVGTIQNIKEHFVTRAQTDEERPLSDRRDDDDALIDGPDSIHRRWRRITGLSFGARKAALSAIIYDKAHEIKYRSPEKAFMWDIWEHEAEKQGFCLLPTARVLRLEVRFKREALSQIKQDGVFHGIDDAYELEGHIPGLWSYAVGHASGSPDGLPDGWMRYIIPTADTNRSRWPVHPDWHIIQSAFAPLTLQETQYEQELALQEELLSDLDEYLIACPQAPAPLSIGGLQKVVEVMTPSGKHTGSVVLPTTFVAYARARRRNVNLRRLVAQIAGCAVTAEAWRRTQTTEVDPDISATFHFLYEEVQDYMTEKQRDFSLAVYKKRVAYDLEQLDTFCA